nr:DUF484 family protein [Pseudomonas sp. NW5]
MDAEQVAAWLAAHPQFFVGRDALLANMEIHHEAGHAISLVERQLGLLRSRNQSLSAQLSTLMEVARQNDRLFERSRRLIVQLLDAESLEELVAAVEDGLRHDFQVPYVSLLLFGPTGNAGRQVTIDSARQALGGLLEGPLVACGVLRASELDFLFPGQHGDTLGSAAVARLEHQSLHGVLALGSPDPQQYRSSLGGVFLAQIAEVLARRLTTLGAAS